MEKYREIGEWIRLFNETVGAHCIPLSGQVRQEVKAILHIYYYYINYRACGLYFHHLIQLTKKLIVSDLIPAALNHYFCSSALHRYFNHF